MRHTHAGRQANGRKVTDLTGSVPSKDGETVARQILLNLHSCCIFAQGKIRSDAFDNEVDRRRDACVVRLDARAVRLKNIAAFKGLSHWLNFLTENLFGGP